MSDPTGIQATETRTLSTLSWAGPRAGHYLAEFGGVSLIPGQLVNFAVAACNAYGVAVGGSGCGPQSANITLQTSYSTPGDVSAPTVQSINSTHLVVKVGAASHTGGPPIDRYEIRWRTKPATLSHTVTLQVVEGRFELNHELGHFCNPAVACLHLLTYLCFTG